MESIPVVEHPFGLKLWSVFVQTKCRGIRGSGVVSFLMEAFDGIAAGLKYAGKIGFVWYDSTCSKLSWELGPSMRGAKRIAIVWSCRHPSRLTGMHHCVSWKFGFKFQVECIYAMELQTSQPTDGDASLRIMGVW